MILMPIGAAVASSGIIQYILARCQDNQAISDNNLHPNSPLLIIVGYSITLLGAGAYVECPSCISGHFEK